MSRIPNGLFLLLTALLPLVCGAQSPVDEASSPQSQRYLAAYESMTTADWLMKREMYQDAAALYDDALKQFKKLASDFPAWQTNLMAFRINYCRSELNRALNPGDNSPAPRKLAGPAAETMRKPESPPPPEPAAPHGPPTADAVQTGELKDKITRAFRLEQTDDFKSALILYRSILAQQKQNTAALAGAGRCCLRMGGIDEARDLLFQWSIIPSPDDGLNLLLALIYCHDGQYAKAIQLVEIALNNDKSNAVAHVIMGVALAGTGQTKDAISEMQNALSIDPRLSEAHYNLARLILAQNPGQTETAHAYYLNALKFGAAPDPALAKLLQR